MSWGMEQVLRSHTSELTTIPRFGIWDEQHQVHLSFFAVDCEPSLPSLIWPVLQPILNLFKGHRLTDRLMQEILARIQTELMNQVKFRYLFKPLLTGKWTYEPIKKG